MLDMLILPLVLFGLVVFVLLNHRLKTGTFLTSYRIIEEHDIGGYKCMRVQRSAWYDPCWFTKETFTIYEHDPDQAKVAAAEYFRILVANKGKSEAITLVKQYP